MDTITPSPLKSPSTPLRDEEKIWNSKKISIDEVSSKIENGCKIFIASCAATPEATLQALVDDYRLMDIQIIQMIPGGNLPHLQQSMDRFRTSSFYSFRQTGYFAVAAAKKEGLKDYTPVGINQVPRLLQEKKLQVDVAILKVTPPQKGFVSLGIGLDATMDVLEYARTVIVEVNTHMPWTEGPSKIPCSQIDFWMDISKPLLTTYELWPELKMSPPLAPSVIEAMARHLIPEVPDRSTIRLGVSPLVYGITPFLRQRKDLGLHTDIFTEVLLKLQQEGVITNQYKTLQRGRTVVSQAHGMTQEMYTFCDRNPAIEFHPSSYTCNPNTLTEMENLVAIVGALKADLTGQIATDSIAHKFYGGVWSDEDSIRGAKYSKGGKPLILLPSQSLAGRSNIVLDLPPGTGVSITRSDVEYVITEYGTAYLYGKSIRERCLAMIEIAHPDYRAQLLEQAKEYKYISQSQPGRSMTAAYPSHLECYHTTKTGKQVLVRPIKAVDEDDLRNFFHKLSDHSVYLRYFRKLKSMPQRVLQKTADVDYTEDMALVVLSPPNHYHHEIVALGQWVSDPRGISVPEIAFQVRDDWQGEGLGSYLFERILEIAQSLGVEELKADVLSGNQGMKKILERSKAPFTKHSDFGVITYVFNLRKLENAGTTMTKK